MNRTVQGSCTAAGFTTIELVAAMLSAAILAITMGAMLEFGYHAWFSLGTRAEMQRDAAVAMDVLTSAVRAGTNLSFAAGALTVKFSGQPDAVIDTSGGTLRYQPSVASSNRCPLVCGTLQDFSVSIASNTATVVLSLSSGTDTVSNNLVITRRNSY